MNGKITLPISDHKLGIMILLQRQTGREMTAREFIAICKSDNPEEVLDRRHPARQPKANIDS